MSTRWMRLGFLGAGVALLGACAGEQVWLGQAQHGLDDCEGSECADAGPGLQTPQPPPAQPPPAQPPTFPMPQPGDPELVEVAVQDRCAVPVTAELAVELRIKDGCGATPPVGCSFKAGTLALSADGGAWIVGRPAISGDLTLQEVRTAAMGNQWLLRYRADGSLRCRVEIPSHANGFSINHALAIADDGKLWLASLWSYGTKSSGVQRYDDDCQALGGPLDGLTEVRAIANVAGAGVAIASGEINNAFTLHDQNGQVLWSRPGNGDFRASVGAAQGSPLLLGTSRRRGAAGGITVHAFDNAGNTRWQTTTKGNAYWHYAAVGYDQQGNFTLAFRPSDPRGEAPLDYFTDVENIDPTGQTRWVLRVPAWTNIVAAVAPSGVVYVASPTAFDLSLPPAIAAIAQDGNSCSRMTYDAPEVGQLAVSPTARLWYAAPGEFGRFGPLP